MSTNTKPKIAITGPNKSGSTAWFFTALNIRLAGGKPIRVTPNSFDGTLDYDGVIIGGGSDIHPDNYIKEETPMVKRTFWIRLKECVLYPMELLNRLGSSEYDKDRDDMEIKFIHFALDNNLPLLGICRGHQLLNAELGGSMYESTLPLLKNDMRIRSPFPRKTVLYTTSDSLIAEIAGDDPLKVNAIHSQAVAEPADALTVTARENAGINQVIESNNGDKVLGVQWHPEYLFYMKAHRKIFSWLIREAKK
ncbi:gamma-glutamyl-gamma-aminobutyrate hydrolase family protein [Paraglaciecola arctica]|uniref:gamma-glutamyl-gamma-aminobutyrate hydrolase family protein n=1 Tax=Paraglaciecola arctica TaxID=1128911 RepID=UPI001C0675ED|nr:gamma-glutamyl-gamma-aminobutyrate hydrolase family protein [Paraglaciecola arctica]MBU3004536.1 gamma-glutamyl-gamma-aminobutyrate hydrolase family protein [Paraglaciecola arctica]